MTSARSTADRAAAKKADKTLQILEGALRAFARHGYHGSQVSKIAKEAGVADGTIYLYFKNKEEILIRLFEWKLGNLVEKFHASLEQTTNAPDAIRQVCEIHYTELENNVDLAYVTQIELRQSSMEMRKAIGQAVKPYIKLIEDLLAQGVRENAFRPDLDIKLTRLLVFGAMDEVVTSWLISGRKYRLRDQIDGTVSFLLQGIGRKSE